MCACLLPGLPAVALVHDPVLGLLQGAFWLLVVVTLTRTVIGDRRHLATHPGS